MAFGKKTTNKTVEQSVHLPTVEKQRLALKLVGEAPLIVHRFEEKAITEMLAKQRGLPVERQKKNPHKDYEASKYKNAKNQDCVPVMTIKKAMTEAATFADNITKKAVKGGFFIIGEYAPLEFSECRMRTDVVRLSGIGKVPDLRFRAEYLDWSVKLVVDFDPRLVSPDEVMYLLRSAGTSIGICEWRPQKDGNFGTFSLEPLHEKEIPAIVAACKIPPRPFVLPEWVMREINNPEDLSKAIEDAKKASGTGTGSGRGRKAAAPVEPDADEPGDDPGEPEIVEAPKRRGRPPKNGANGKSNGVHADEAS